MKAYKEYMSRVSVSDTLHRKILAGRKNNVSARPSIFVKRFATVACLFALILLSIAVVPKLLQRSPEPIAGDNASALQPDTDKSPTDGKSSVLQSDTDKTVLDSNSPVLQSDKDISASVLPKDFTLNFNKAGMQSTAKIYIPGHFWQELTNDELQALFPGLMQKYNVRATANFMSDENGASLFSIDAHTTTVSGLRAYIQIAPGETSVDYIIVGDTKTTDVLGTEVTAGYFESSPNSKGESNVICFAKFKLSETAYYVEIVGRDTEKETVREEITDLIGLLINAGAADLDIFDPVIPELRNDRLDLDEARADPDFGSYLPTALPDGFVFEDAVRLINQERNGLTAHWAKGMGYIDWHVTKLTEGDKKRITSVQDVHNYDLSLYPIPRADSVPDELREIVGDPIFLSEELTLEAVLRRTYEAADSGDISGPRMQFGILYGDILVEINVKGAQPEAIFEMVSGAG
ncbi:MAG: hypothetical protein GX279_12610 [Clostridiaceae bacterium]|nr:hypothetical protein [Clostridiaceae bacterium]